MYDASAIPTVRAILELRPLRGKGLSESVPARSSRHEGNRDEAHQTRFTSSTLRTPVCGSTVYAGGCTSFEVCRSDEIALAFGSLQKETDEDDDRPRAIDDWEHDVIRRPKADPPPATLVLSVARDAPVLGARRQTPRRAAPARGLGGPRDPLRPDRACPRGWRSTCFDPSCMGRF
jgi:hypothetical protein